MNDHERRRHPRFKVNVPVEVYAEGSDAPTRSTTSDISLDGCYVETMYPLPVGTSVELKLQLEDTLLIRAKVVTSHPQVGYGIEFVRMLPEDHDELRAFLHSVALQEAAEAEKNQ